MGSTTGRVGRTVLKRSGAITAILGLAMLIGASSVAGPGPPVVVQAIGCLIEPAQVALVGSPVIGVLDRIAVERGDQVRKGQLIASLNANVERAALRVAEQRSRHDADVLAAEANVELARQRLQRADDLAGTNYISSQALDQLRAENEVALQRLEQATDQRRIWQRELRVARAQLELRHLRSPFSGIVVDRYAEPGERVEEKPIVKIAQVDPLRVELMVPASSYGKFQPGDQLQVLPELPAAELATASVTRVDNIIDAASNTFRVRLSLPNPGNRLPAGLRCRVDASSIPTPAKVAAAPPIRK
jgi:RND family efflux transporter MFP subunit